jgi:DNA-binding NarL/FixJ family response regulator
MAPQGDRAASFGSATPMKKQPPPPAPGPEKARATRVVLVDPHPLVRTGLRLLLAQQPDMEVEGEAGTEAEALEVLRHMKSRLGVIVLISLNIGGSQLDGFGLIRTIREGFPWLPIIALGSNSDAMTISKALFYGADGFIDKMAPPEGFLRAIQRGAQGEVVLEGLPADWYVPVAQGIDWQRESASAGVLTDREREVLTIATEGLTARQMANRLGLAERTVTTHLFRIYKKLGADSRVGAITAATRMGLIGLRNQ